MTDGRVLDDLVEGMIDDLARRPAPAPPSLSRALEAELGQLAPVATRRPLRQLALLVMISLIYGAGVLAMVAMRRDLHELPMAWLAGVGLAWLAGFVIPVYLALVPRDGQVLPRWKLAGLSAVIGAAGFILLGLALHPSGPSSVAELPHQSMGLGCLQLGVLTSIVPVIVGALFLRRALPVGSRAIAAALGAGGGSLGGLMLHLHCHVTDALHVGLVHGGVVAAAAVLSAWLVPRATDVK
ncbi:MAG TPA: NrsF family protein [Kofleriaceae bacterium]